MISDTNLQQESSINIFPENRSAFLLRFTNTNVCSSYIVLDFSTNFEVVKVLLTSSFPSTTHDIFDPPVSCINNHSLHKYENLIPIVTELEARGIVMDEVFEIC